MYDILCCLICVFAVYGVYSAFGVLRSFLLRMAARNAAAYSANAEYAPDTCESCGNNCESNCSVCDSCGGNGEKTNKDSPEP